MKLSINCAASIGVIKKKKILITKLKEFKTIYFIAPKNAIIKVTKTNVFIKNENNNFLNLIKNVERNILYGTKKKLILLGLGFKIFNAYLTDQKIQFKLGFSHIIYLTIKSKNITFSFFKFKRVSGKLNIIISGDNPQLIGNFANKIKLLKTPNKYKAKGFFEKNQKQKLKAFKKK